MPSIIGNIECFIPNLAVIFLSVSSSMSFLSLTPSLFSSPTFSSSFFSPDLFLVSSLSFFSIIGCLFFSISIAFSSSSFFVSTGCFFLLVRVSSSLLFFFSFSLSCCCFIDLNLAGPFGCLLKSID